MNIIMKNWSNTWNGKLWVNFHRKFVFSVKNLAESGASSTPRGRPLSRIFFLGWFFQKKLTSLKIILCVVQNIVIALFKKSLPHFYILTCGNTGYRILWNNSLFCFTIPLDHWYVKLKNRNLLVAQCTKSWQDHRHDN